MKATNSSKSKKKKKSESSVYLWVIKVFFLAIAISAVLSLASETVLSGADVVVAVLILAVFISLGIVFDVVGVAVTAADAKPFHSMASHKTKGAKEALALIRNADHVSSICNDVVGDICGIVSGTTGAVIVLQLQQALNTTTVLVSVAVTALISGLTIGGKAMGKNFAMKQSKKVVYLAGRFLHLFSRK